MAMADPCKSSGASPISVGPYHQANNDVPSRRAKNCPGVARLLCTLLGRVEGAGQRGSGSARRGPQLSFF